MLRAGLVSSAFEKPWMLLICRSPMSTVPFWLSPELSAVGLQPLSARIIASIVFVSQSYFSTIFRNCSQPPVVLLTRAVWGEGETVASTTRGFAWATGATSKVCCLIFFWVFSRLFTLNLNFECSQLIYRYLLSC